MNEMPNLIPIGCQCGDVPECICGQTEKVLRAFASGILSTMTPDQREWCLKEIDSVEGYNRRDYERAYPADLARGVLSAWTDYARDKGLL